MRSPLLVNLATAVTIVSGLSYALEANDSMAARSSASQDDKTKLVTELLKRDGRENLTPKVVKCLDAAADVPGHADLPISKVIKACEKGDDEPV